MSNLERIRSIFQADQFARDLGIVIDQAEPGSAVCSVELEARHHNAGGFAQGGLIYTLADFAFAVASNQEAMGAVTQSCAVHYLRPVSTGRLTARAQLEHQTRNTCLYRVAVTGEGDRLIAIATVSGFIKARPKEE